MAATKPDPTRRGSHAAAASACWRGFRGLSPLIRRESHPLRQLTSLRPGRRPPGAGRCARLRQKPIHISGHIGVTELVGVGEPLVDE
jgi:hypothetical protein